MTDFVFGTAQFDGRYGATRNTLGTDAGAASRMLQKCADAGFTAIDTAPAYGPAEEYVGASATALAVHTKIDPTLRPAASLARSLRRLRRRSVAALSFHDPDIPRNDREGLVDEAYDLIGDRAGMLGASIYERAQFDAAVEDHRIAMVQIPFNVLDRRIATSSIEDASRTGTIVYARSIFLQGVLLSPPGALPARLSPLAAHVAELHAIARDAHLSPTELAVGWVRSTRGLGGIVVGADEPSQLLEIASALQGAALPERVLERLTSMASPPDPWVDPRTWTRT